jgi:hypothetical protein
LIPFFDSLFDSLFLIPVALLFNDPRPPAYRRIPCCKIVTVHTKSKPARQACCEYGQQSAIVCKRNCGRFPSAVLLAGDAARHRKKPMKIGITVTTVSLTYLPDACGGQQFRA